MMCIRLVTTAVLLLGLLAVPACLELSTTNEGGGGAGTSTAAGMISECSAADSTCSACVSCEGESETGQCRNEYKACRNEPNCAKFDDCIKSCSSQDLMCLELCFAMIADADSTFNDYYFCMYCGACTKSCADTIPC